MPGQWVKTEDFNAACDAACAVETAVGEAIVDTLERMCSNASQLAMAQVISTAMMIEKFDASKTALGGNFGESVEIVLAQLREIPVEADGTRDIGQLAQLMEDAVH
jgi:hypothetical protein